MRSNWNPIVVAVVCVVAFVPLGYDLLQPIDFRNYKESRVPVMQFLGILSVFFACVLLSRRFARICARTPADSPKTIRDAQVSAVLLVPCWLLV